MSARPFFNTTTRDLEKLFTDAASRHDAPAIKALADELAYRKTELARQLALKIDKHVRDQGQETAPATRTGALLPPARVQAEGCAGLGSAESSLEAIDTHIAKTMPDPNIIDRLRGLLAYVVQTAKLKGTPHRTVEQHGFFKANEHELRGLPGIEFDLGSEEDEVWLRVERLHESAPPPPKTKLLGTLILQSKNPAVEPHTLSIIDRKTAEGLGIDLPELGDAAKPIPIDILPIKAQLDAELETYVAHIWRPWADAEKEVRKTISKYASFFAVHQMLQGNLVDSPIELVLGLGHAVWERPEGRISYPLITKLVELSVDESTHAIEVRPRSPDPYLELDIYTALDNLGVSDVARAGKQFFSKMADHFSPFASSTFEPLLKSAASLLDPNGVYWPNQTTADDRQLPKADENLKVTDTWVLFARARTSNLFIQDLEKFEKLLEDGLSLGSLSPATLALVADPSVDNQDPTPIIYRGLSNIDANACTAAKARDLYFPMPYNDEQVQIVQMLDHHDGVVVQGPPGTGKTHTIANVISHYLASGKRVLVTSMKDPALAVLQEKLPEEIRPLAISLLSSEADGMKQFENSIRKISAEVTRINRAELRQEVKQLEQHIDQFHAQLAKTEHEINRWASKNIEPIQLDDQRLMPLEVAQEVAAYPDEAAWIPDALTIEAMHSPEFGDADVLALRVARGALGKDLALLDQTLPALDAFPATEQLLQLHQEMKQLASLNAMVESATLPPIRDMEAATIDAAIEARSQVIGLQNLLKNLQEYGDAWLPKLETLLRKSTSNDGLLTLFKTLRSDTLSLVNSRTQFLSRPVLLPEGFLATPELPDAIDNLSQGKKAFGFAGMFGKSAQKRLLDQVQVLGRTPIGENDWNHVLLFIRFRQECSSIFLRWNAVAPDLHLPNLLSAEEVISRAPSLLSAFDSLQNFLRDERALSSSLPALFPAWIHAGKIPYDAAKLDSAIEIIDHNLTRNRLASTWKMREGFSRAITPCQSEIAQEISALFNLRLGDSRVQDAELQSQWSELMTELRRQQAHSLHLQTILSVTEKIERSGAPQWAQQLRTEAMVSAHDALLPDNWRLLWRRRRLLTLVESMDGRERLRQLSQKRAEMEADLARLYQASVTKLTWLQMADKASPAVRSALEAYRIAITRIGKGTGVRAPRFRKDARDAAERASPAIPCWIMPHYRVSESLPVALGEFDLVIIDEASQSDLTALPAILRAKKILVVGDDQQVSPEGVGLEEDKIRSLMNQFLGGQVGLYRPQMSPDKSIYDLFKVVFAHGQVMLREHFRCVGPIIEYSKREFYNHELRPLRVPRSSERLDPPLVDVHVVDGARGNGKTNEGEARFILEEIRKITQDPSMSKRTIGVVSLVGSEQAKLVWDKIAAELGESTIEKHHMAFGDARTFQGKERDIMFLSMVDSGRAQASSQEMFRQRYNVAASRARDRMYLVRSITLDELSRADKLRAGLMQHFNSPYLQNEEEVSDLRRLCESPFEREMYDALVERGYRLHPQVKAGNFRIDLVVEGAGDARLAIECDGDQYHGPDQWQHDMRRQRILERAGWKFWRCFASTFVSARQATLDDLIATLQQSGIEPVGSKDSRQSLHSQFRSYEAFLENPLPETEQA
ncbi:AAA domain-containing protein [Xanthomonas campestris]|uniref:AAA domain-containing protein n=1 Tax=Xanthomonas campestris TaxID=339 RepID=UPI0038902279